MAVAQRHVRGVAAISVRLEAPDLWLQHNIPSIAFQVELEGARRSGPAFGPLDENPA
jgi:hypothetical protein